MTSVVRIEELLQAKAWSDLQLDYRINLTHLHYRLNVLRRACKIPFIITSGFRSAEDHVRIYREINEKRKEEGKKPVMMPTTSQHLFGCAADINDSNGAIKKWVSGLNEVDLQRFGLWYEHFDATPRHLHCQIYQPESGNRFFVP